MFYIRHNSDNFTIIDCCLNEANKRLIVSELRSRSEDKNIIRFIATHPDDDHIGGLVYLDDQLSLTNFYCGSNSARKKIECWTNDFGRYCALRDGDKAFKFSKGCTRRWMNLNSEGRGASGINFHWPVTTNAEYQEALRQAADGESPNNISPIFTYEVDKGASFMWMGDIETDFQEKVKDEVNLPSVDVLFAPHHGRESGRVITEWLAQADPNIVVIGEAPSDQLHYYLGYHTITQNSAGDIIFDCSCGKIEIYVSSPTYSVDFLADEELPNAYGAYYLGTYTTKAAS